MKPKKYLAEDKVDLKHCQVHPSAKFGYRSYANLSVFGANVTIGRYCSIGRWCSIPAGRHFPELLTTHPFLMSPEFRPPNLRRTGVATEIGSDVWIGDHVVVMQGCSIGHGAVVGANSVVTKDVEPYTIVVGAPARPLRRRFSDDAIERLLQLQWWRYDERILASIDYDDQDAMIEELARRVASQEYALHPEDYR